MQNEEIFKKIENLYIKKFDKKPEYFVKCPGRVNLIGNDNICIKNYF